MAMGGCPPSFGGIAHTILTHSNEGSQKLVATHGGGKRIVVPRMRVLPKSRRRELREKHTTQRRADHRHFEARRGGINDGGVWPSERDFGADLQCAVSEVS